MLKCLLKCQMCSLLFAALSSMASPRLWLLLPELLAVLLHWLGCQAVHLRLSTGDKPHQLATLLSTGDGPLEIVHWILSTEDCQLEIVHCRLSTVDYPLETADWTLSTGDCPLKTIHWRLSTGDCPLETVHWRLSTGDCPLETAPETVHGSLIPRSSLPAPGSLCHQPTAGCLQRTALCQQSVSPLG